MLKLFIPRQERLIPQGKFKILVDDEINKEKNNKNPLRVGVTVKGNDEKYYTYIGANKRGEIGKDLYLNLKTKRFVETIIEFENPNLKTDTRENWIKLNKSNFQVGTSFKRHRRIKYLGKGQRRYNRYPYKKKS